PVAVPPRPPRQGRTRLSTRTPATVWCFACLYSFAVRGSLLLERVREPRIGEKPLVGQRPQEGNEGGLLVIGEIHSGHARGEVGVLLNPFAVMIDDLLQGVKTSVVHVGSGVLDIPQGRRLEFTELTAVESDVANTAIRDLVVCIEAGVPRTEHGKAHV